MAHYKTMTKTYSTFTCSLVKAELMDLHADYRAYMATNLIAVFVICILVHVKYCGRSPLWNL